MRFLTIGLMAWCATAGLATGVAGQRHAKTDAALAGSLLTAVPLPVSTGAWPLDTLRPGRRLRAEVQYSRLARGGVAGARAIVGVRWDSPGRDSVGWSASVVGLRTAVTRNREGRATPSALELQLGGRTLGYMEQRWAPDVGLDVLVGLSRLDRTEPDFTLALRAPVEWVLPAGLAGAAGPGGLILSLVPTMAWGDVHVEGCVDDGPGDNCGDLGIQLEPGRTRFLMAAGIGVVLEPLGLTASVGATQLLALRQEPRLTLGLAWGH